MVLAKYMLTHHQHDLAGKTVIEIGAGGGLVGLAVAKGCQLGDNSLLINDQKVMLGLMHMNIELNQLAGKVTAELYDWGSPKPKFDGDYPDLLLAADCVYFEPAFPLLLQTLEDLIGPETRCYFCFKKRRKADGRFVRDMRKKFDARVVPYVGGEEDQRDGIYLFELRRRPNR